MTILLLATGLVLIVEGLVYVLAPSLIEQMLAALQVLPVAARRLLGGIALVGGLVLIWLAFLMGLTIAP